MPEPGDQGSQETEIGPLRRRLLAWMSVALGGFAATIVGIPVVGFLVGPWFAPTKTAWRSVGKVDQFAVGTTTQVNFQDASPLSWGGVSAMTAAWLRREAVDQFIAYSINCTHLGCPVRWEAGAKLFLCPCHGGVYYSDGQVAAGPPPLPLPRYPVRVNNGEVEVLAGPLPLPSNELSQYSNYASGAGGGASK